MWVFYLVFIVFGFVALSADFALRYTEKIKSFGSEKRFFGKKEHIIPIERFLPRNLTMCFAAGLAFGCAGLALDVAGMGWLLSLPCALGSALLLCFFIQHILYRLVFTLSGGNIPADADLAGTEALVLKALPVDGYGEVKFLYNGFAYRVNAVSANNTFIAAGEKAVIVLYTDGMCFAERQDEVLSGDSNS